MKKKYIIVMIDTSEEEFYLEAEENFWVVEESFDSLGNAQKWLAERNFTPCEESYFSKYPQYKNKQMAATLHEIMVKENLQHEKKDKNNSDKILTENESLKKFISKMKNKDYNTYFLENLLKDFYIKNIELLKDGKITKETYYELKEHFEQAFVRR